MNNLCRLCQLSVDPSSVLPSRGDTIHSRHPHLHPGAAQQVLPGGGATLVIKNEQVRWQNQKEDRTCTTWSATIATLHIAFMSILLQTTSAVSHCV